uniref:Uncharacterized protein n=1 Tax=Siphoviridae sp. ctuvC1 TaxID=2826507 RepID=A0A8S5M058_9CAUD|nr:MAG TPA: hypothetical protein [Siphoviridae sp. ctuvC1]
MKKRVKLRAMTAEEFCLSHHCKDCPENMPFNIGCSLDIQIACNDSGGILLIAPLQRLSREYAFQHRVLVGYNLYNFEEKTV